MTWNPDKYGVIHFTRQRKVDRLQLSAKPNIGMKEDPVSSFKVLGLWVDSKLSWKAHIKNTTTKVTGYIAAMGRLLGSTWGATFKRSRLIYTAVIRPTMTYGCNVWYAPNTPSRTQPKESTIQPLIKLQNQALHKIAGAYKATPIPTLEKETGIEPLPIHMQGQATKHALKCYDSDGQRAIENAKQRIQRAPEENKSHTARSAYHPSKAGKNSGRECNSPSESEKGEGS